MSRELLAVAFPYVLNMEDQVNWDGTTCIEDKRETTVQKQLNNFFSEVFLNVMLSNLFHGGQSVLSYVCSGMGVLKSCEINETH